MDLCIFPQGRIGRPAITAPGYYCKQSTKKTKRGGSKRSLKAAISNAQKHSEPTRPNDPIIQTKKLSGDTAHDTHSSASEAPITPTGQVTTTATPTSPCSIAVGNYSDTHAHLSEKETLPVATQKAEDYYTILEAEWMDDLVSRTTTRVHNTLSRSPYIERHQNALLKETAAFTIDEDFCRGSILGEGGFASVYDITVLGPERIHGHTSSNEYVVKHLSARLGIDHSTNSKNKYKQLHLGAKDLVIEAHLLAALDHRNILKLKGCSEGGLSSFCNLCRTDAYFLILPKLTCTLADKISEWKRNPDHPSSANSTPLSLTEAPLESMESPPLPIKRDHSHFSWTARIRQHREHKEARRHQDHKFFCERLQIIVDLLKALEYLHARRIMHRGGLKWEYFSFFRVSLFVHFSHRPLVCFHWMTYRYQTRKHWL